ncbi:MAG: DUF6356 family protein [Rickettsiales bacterium]|jgi:hypothetical protein|nr:DUF6356 family protein [Rickettsiales bacterium]
MQLIRHYGARIKNWLISDRHKAKAKMAREEIERAFTEHPKETGESYLVHLWFTVTMTLRLIFSAVVLFIHGFLPFLFVRTASSQMETIYGIMRSRIPEARREELKQRWHV